MAGTLKGIPTVKIRKAFVKATIRNLKIGEVASRIYLVTLNGFMSLHDAVKMQLNRNERIEHVEVHEPKKYDVAPSVSIWV